MPRAGMHDTLYRHICNEICHEVHFSSPKEASIESVFRGKFLAGLFTSASLQSKPYRVGKFA